eukprot:1722295-Prymnesium_polylepis.1
MLTSCAGVRCANAARLSHTMHDALLTTHCSLVLARAAATARSLTAVNASTNQRPLGARQRAERTWRAQFYSCASGGLTDRYFGSAG